MTATAATSASMRAVASLPAFRKIVREHFDHGFHKIDGRGEAVIRHRVRLRLASVRDDKVPSDRFPVHLDAIRRPYDDAMSFVVCLPNALGRMVSVDSL